MTEPTSTPFIDLTHEMELTWLSRQRKDERSLSPDIDDIAALDEVLVSSIHSSIAAALAQRDISVYFDEEELNDIVDELIGAVDLFTDRSNLLEWFPSSEQVVNYDDFCEQTTAAAIYQLRREIENVEILLGIPPEEELNSHARLVGEDTFSRTPGLHEVDDTNVSEAISSDIVSFGKKVIEKSLGPDVWATIVKGKIEKSIRQYHKAPQDARVARIEAVAKEVDEQLTERILVESVFEVLDTPTRQSHLWELRQLIQTAWQQGKLSDSDTKALLSEYIGHSQLPSPMANADTGTRPGGYEDGRTKRVDIDDISLSTAPRESEQTHLFFFPAMSRTRQEQLLELIQRGVPMETVRKHGDAPLPLEGNERIALWTLAARGPPHIAASKMRSGDIALFYGASGEYTHKARIAGRTANQELAYAVTDVDGAFKDANLDLGVDRPIVVFFQDVTPVSISSKTLHAALGYNRPYPTWNTVNQQRVSSLTSPERGLEDVLSRFDRYVEQE